jgi:DNA polymerase-3 subunit epsilon
MNIWQKAWFQWQLRQRINGCPEEVKTWLKALPPLSTPLSDVTFLAIDVETTGLNPKKDAILSMGWVPVVAGRIQAGRGEHHVIKTTASLTEESIKIHGLTHQKVRDGQPLERVMHQLWQALRGTETHSHIPLVHFARIEQAFLKAASQQLYGCQPPILMVDTFQLARRQHASQPLVDASQFRLAALRRHYHLPDAPPHQALEDAMATAELFLAQLKYRSDTHSLRLQDLIG